MIDEQHPMQIGLFPLDIKCHTPQQQQQQLQLQQQHQQPQPQTGLLMNGNAGMLTTTTTTGIVVTSGQVATATATQAQAASTMVTPNARNAQQKSTAATTATAPTTTPQTTSASTTLIPTPMTMATLQRTTTAAAAATDALNANVNGNCNNNNNTSNNNKKHDKIDISANENNDGRGLGPGPPTSTPPNALTIVATSPTKINRAITAATTATATTNNVNASSTAATAASVSSCMLLEECNSPNAPIGGINCGPLCMVAGVATDPLALNVQCLNNNNCSSHHHQHHHNHQHSHHHHHQQHHHQQIQQQQLMQQHQRLQHQIEAIPTATLQHCSTLQQLPNGQQHIGHQQQQHTSSSSLGIGGLNSCTSIVVGGDVLSLQLPCGGGGVGGIGNLNSGINARLTSLAGLNHQCAYCCQPICDRYIMRVVDTSFHESCLKCSTCSLHLVHSCFARDGKLYCRIDYERLFMRNRCLGCGHKIASDELVMRTLENVFHLKCFACVVCGALLKKGEQYVVKQGQLFCRFDYEKEVEMLQGYDFYGDDLFPPKLDGRRGPKRPRTILNTQQRRAFKASFEVSPKPCRKVRENLAKETGLSLRIVQVWFQNQRAKVKKIQKKAKQEHAKGASDSQDSQESDSSLAKIKDETHSDSESLLESPYSACGGGGVGGGSGGGGGGGGGSGGSSTGIGLGEIGADGLAKLRCIKDENENAPFNCMETNKENCNKTNEPILNTILGLSYATFQQLMGPFTQSPMVNPIDRLYSMQNSYFRSEELNFQDCGKEITEN